MSNIIDWNELHKRKQSSRNTYNVASLTNNDVSIEIKLIEKETQIIVSMLKAEIISISKEINQNNKMGNKSEVEYWELINMTFSKLVDKLLDINNISIVKKLSFIELDCLVGAMEMEMHKKFLDKIQAFPLEDVSSNIKEIQSLYKSLVPTYEEYKQKFKHEKDNPILHI